MAADTLVTYTTAPAAEINFDVNSGARQIYNGVMTRNITVNFRASSTASLSSILDNKMVEVSLFLRNDSKTRWYANFIKVDGQFHYPDWLNASAPKSGTSSRVIEYRLRFYKIGAQIFSFGQTILYGVDPTVKRV